MLKLLTVALLAAPLFAGGFILDLQPDTSKSSVHAQIESCAKPADSIITATAEHGNQSVPLKVKEFSVQLPTEGTWTVKVVGTHPQYKNYASKVQIEIHDGAPDWSTVKRF